MYFSGESLQSMEKQCQWHVRKATRYRENPAVTTRFEVGWNCRTNDAFGCGTIPENRNTRSVDLRERTMWGEISKFE